MKIPKMILFDYGQTLIAEQKFDGVKGTEAVLQYATRNKYQLSAEQVQAKANEIRREYMEEMHSIGRFDLALEKAGLEPDEVWYIGDQYECDVNGALNAGLLPIWYIGAIDLPYTEDTNILTVKTWNEIERYME